MNILVFIISAIGLYGFITKLSAAGATLQLYFERDYTCPESFRGTQKKSDLLHSANCFMVSLYAVILLAYGLVYLFRSSAAFAPAVLLYACMVNVLHIVVNEQFLVKSGLKEKMNSIMNQWKTQKRITKNNDDEVRLYRMIKESYVNNRYNLLYLAGMLVMYFIVK